MTLLGLQEWISKKKNTTAKTKASIQVMKNPPKMRTMTTTMNYMIMSMRIMTNCWWMM